MLDSLSYIYLLLLLLLIQRCSIQSFRKIQESKKQTDMAIGLLEVQLLNAKGLRGTDFLGIYISLIPSLPSFFSPSLLFHHILTASCFKRFSYWFCSKTQLKAGSFPIILLMIRKSHKIIYFFGKWKIIFLLFLCEI